MAIEALVGGAVNSAVNQGLSDINTDKKQRLWIKRQDYLEKQQKAAEQRQFDYNKQLQDYVYSQNLEQWKRENEYNSPAAQMARFGAAGLNANLMYSQMGSGATSPEMSIGDVGTGAAPTAPNADAPFVGFDYIAAQNALSQSKLIDAQVNKTNAETLGVISDNALKSGTLSANIDKAFAELANTVADTDLKTAETTGQEIQNTVDENIAPTKIAQAEADLENTKKQGLNLDKTNKLLDEQINNLKLDSRLKSIEYKIKEYEKKIASVGAENAETKARLENELTAAKTAFANNQASYVAKQIASYDAELTAKLALSAAERINRLSFSDLAVSRKNYQDFQNRMNEILLDPTKETDAKTYFSALLLKNLNETSFKDIIDTIWDMYQDTKDGSAPDVPDAPAPKKRGLGPRGVGALYDWKNKHPNATQQEIDEITEQIRDKFGAE